MAVTGRLDKHFTALWDGGHIKFWSIETLNELLAEVGFNNIEFRRVGRIAPLAKSMIALAREYTDEEFANFFRGSILLEDDILVEKLQKRGILREVDIVAKLCTAEHTREPLNNLQTVAHSRS